MLTKLLQRETCADCRLCCIFDRYDVWETPIISTELRERILKMLPDAEFVSKGQESYIFRVRELDENDLFTCPLLDPAKGCRLGTDKPFDCQIWPFRIMDVNGRRAITMAPICDAMTALPLRTLLDFLKQELAETIFAYAAAHPDVVQPYDDLYPILYWEPKKFD